MNDWAPGVTVMVIAVCVTIYHIAKLKRPDTTKQIAKLAELKEKGLLTEEEFTKEKRKILGN